MFEYLANQGFGPLEVGVFFTVTILSGALLFGRAGGSDSARLKKRMTNVAGNMRLSAAGGDDPISAELRRRQIRSAMNGETGKKGVSLQARLQQAGLNWSKQKYALVTVISMAVGALGLLAGAGLPPVVALLGGGLIGGLAPYFYVSRTTKKRLKNFSNEFPTALDIIVRGVSAGLPLSECLKTIARETKEPVRSEFQKLNDDQSVGMPLEKAVQRLAMRVPLAETSFFAIVLAVQSRSGGSLSEVLTNLSNVVRGRKMLDAQIKTMSSEAKTSGRLIGAMPLLVAGALFYLSPDYISILTQTGIGRMILAGCALWMFTGVMVMKKMINFEV